MTLPLRPYFAFGLESDAMEELTLTLPQKFPIPEEGPAMGDEDKSAAGLPVGYYVGWEYAVVVGFRFLDTEYADVMDCLRFLMQNKHLAFLFRFDADDPATEYSVYLESPKLPDRLKPTHPDPRNAELWEITLTLRSSNGQVLRYPLPSEE